MKLTSWVVLILCLSWLNARSQTAVPIRADLIPKDGYGPAKIIVKLDPLTRIPVGNIPFDRTFHLRMYFDPAVLTATPIRSFYLISRTSKGALMTELGYYLISSADYDGSDNSLKAFPKSSVEVVVPALLPNANYLIAYSTDASQKDLLQYLTVFNMFYNHKDTEGVANEQAYRTADPTRQEILTGQVALVYYNSNNQLKTIFNKYDGDLTKATPELIAYLLAHPDYPIPSGTAQLFVNMVKATNLTTQQYTVQTSAGLQIVADGGLIFTGFQNGFNTVTPYVGINIALRPLDSDLPFRSLVRNKRISTLQRFTIDLGVTLNSIAKANYRANLFGNDNVMVGLGYKFSHVISVNFGGLIYNNVDPNPLLDKKTVAVAPYVGISINLKIKDALGDIAKVFAYGK